MNNLKNKHFLSLILPILEQLKAQCFDPNEHPNQACMHCSLNCGGNRHDSDCEYQLGEDIMEQIQTVKDSTDYDLSYRKEPRPEAEIQEIKESEMVRIIIKNLTPHLSAFIPLDYSDPNNEGIVCSCSVFEVERKHADDCPNEGIARCLSELFKPTT